jgi:spore coat protein H
MRTTKALRYIGLPIVTIALLASGVLAQDGTETVRPADWTEETHSKSAEPNFDVVFPSDRVNRLDIVIEPENWQTMLDDMTANYGEFGTGSRRTGAPGERRPTNGGNGVPPAGEVNPQGQQPLEDGAVPGGQRPPVGGVNPPVGGMDRAGGGLDFSATNPVWVPADIVFEGLTWTNVGIRFKGNSSLRSSWSSGDLKLPFKLDFDEFEDDYPEIDDQRFYGFKQLTLSSNWSDPSMLREKVTADIFRDMGVPSAHTAFYEVYIDYGQGPVYLGLYTMVEVIDDTVIETQFADDSGNVYKPDGAGATFAAGSFNEASFDKETNQEEADYNDVLALYDALYANTRLTDPAAWRSNLETVFDVDVFLRWLAVNMTVQNWDTYGQMAHNYYLYTDPTTGLITWIPWDNNHALQEGRGPGGGGRASAESGLSLDLQSVGDNWPLIRYLMDDPVYHDRYVSYVEEAVQTVFEPARMTAIYRSLSDLIAPYVANEPSNATVRVALSDQFAQAVDALVQHVNDRYAAATEYVASQR